MNTKKLMSDSQYREEVMATVKACESLRRKKEGAIEVSLSEMVQQRFQVSIEEFFDDLGIDPSEDTINNIFDVPDESVRWLVPEIIREAIRLGLRRSPIWPNLIASEQSISNTTVTFPWWNMSDATPELLNVAETIGMGDVSFGDKKVSVRKMGKGIGIPYEVKQYVSVNIINIFLSDFGIKLGHGIDTMLINTLINGEQANGSESAPVVGISNPVSGASYRDYLRIWIRMARIGRRPDSIISGEDIALDTLDLPEFKDRKAGTTDAKLMMKTPVPNQTDYYIHGSVPDDQSIIVDSSAAVIKLNAQPLLVESEKIVSNQTEKTYATLTTGFAVLYRDGRVIMDQSLDFATNGFPAYMDVDSLENVTIAE